MIVGRAAVSRQRLRLWLAWAERGVHKAAGSVLDAGGLPSAMSLCGRGPFGVFFHCLDACLLTCVRCDVGWREHDRRKVRSGVFVIKEDAL